MNETAVAQRGSVMSAVVIARFVWPVFVMAKRYVISCVLLMVWSESVRSSRHLVRASVIEHRHAVQASTKQWRKILLSTDPADPPAIDHQSGPARGRHWRTLAGSIGVPPGPASPRGQCLPIELRVASEQCIKSEVVAGGLGGLPR